jgi:diguanylate cyclase (GGDEF)-like protein/PAS domain S-box-containing protein
VAVRVITDPGGPVRARTPALHARWVADGVLVWPRPIRARLRPVLKVLVVGPDRLTGTLGPTVLGRPDIDRVHVEKADAALGAAEETRPHLVVIDLPREEAVALIRRLRRNEATRPTAIVWLNRSDAPEAESELALAGANAAVPVPVDPFLWDRRLEELLSVPARRSRRFPVRLRDWSRLLKAADEHEGWIVNIGARGVLLETARELELGTKVGLTFELPGRTAPIAVVGQVVRLAGAEAGLFRVGIEFLIYRGDARERIAAFVETEHEAPDRPGAPVAPLPLTVRPFEEAREWEEELRASEIRKALILDSALDPILTVDHEGRVIEFNAAARRMFGYTRSEILGREVADAIVPPALRDELRRCLSDFVQSGESAALGRRREATAMRADGSLVPIEVAVIPAYVKGRVILSAYIRDLTDRRRDERLVAARLRATQALTASLSLAEAVPAVLDALAHGLDCTEARLWVVDGDPPEPALAGTSSGTSGAPLPSPSDDALARRTIGDGVATWEGPPDRGTGVRLALPVRVGAHLLGVLEVQSERARSRETAWVSALADVGSLLALFLRRERAEADLHRFARYDSLTGLPNRSFFLDTLQRTLSRAARQRTHSALVFLDLDGFKAVNDRLGHAAGDAVLQTMAERLRGGTRTSDLVARIGGDEFVVLVQNLTRADDAALVARGLLDRLARPCRAHDHEVAVSASAGISVYPEDGTDADTLLRNADLAMYRSKQEGKNTYRFFTPEMSTRALERMLLLDNLRVALERDEFEVVYLPIVHRAGPPSLEALLRWRHPKLGLVTPASFIAQAEESGLLLPIGAGVLRSATRFAASLDCDDVRIVVNLSARQFLQPDVVGTVEEALEKSGLEASRLELDLTESTVMTEGEETTEKLRRLREMGVQLALDDFGTGYFSIRRIRGLGFRRLKIDRSLVSGLPANAEQAAHVVAILGLGRSLGLEVVAEGVESEAQRAFLELHGCTGLQGYLLSPPLRAGEVPAFLAKA